MHPAKPTPTFVWHMEDVLDVYHRPVRPSSAVRSAWTRPAASCWPTPRAAPVAPGRPARHDPEYVRKGVVNLFLVTEPLRGWRQVRVSDQRTRLDWAALHQGSGRRPLSRRRADRAGHGPAQHPLPGLALRGVPAGRGQAPGRQAGDPLHAQARQLAEHGRDRAERPRSASAWTGASATAPTMEREVAAWAAARNAATATIDWRFTTADARIKLKRLYPAVHA